MALAAAPRAPLSYRRVTPGALSLPAAAQADPAPPLGCGPPRSGQPPLQPLPSPLRMAQVTPGCVVASESSAHGFLGFGLCRTWKRWRSEVRCLGPVGPPPSHLGEVTPALLPCPLREAP